MTSVKLAIGLGLGLLVACGTQYNGGDTLGGGGSLNPGALGDGGATGQLACDNRTIDSTCESFAIGTTHADAQASCSGKLLTSACPTSNAVGDCTFNGTTDVYYSDGARPHTTADAQATCASLGGTFHR